MATPSINQLLNDSEICEQLTLWRRAFELGVIAEPDMNTRFLHLTQIAVLQAGMTKSDKSVINDARDYLAQICSQYGA